MRLFATEIGHHTLLRIGLGRKRDPCFFAHKGMRAFRAHHQPRRDFRATGEAERGVLVRQRQPLRVK